MAYYHIMIGLRGCYMPDSAYTIQCDTRRELRKSIDYEANNAREGGAIGLSKRNVSWAAAHAWRKSGAILPYSIERGAHPAFSIEISRATRSEYLANKELD